MFLGCLDALCSTSSAKQKGIPSPAILSMPGLSRLPLHDEYLTNGRTYRAPRPCTLDGKDVQSLWCLEAGTLDDNSSPEPGLQNLLIDHLNAAYIEG
ncbi:hypothetical protein CDD82_798 [Ophiocordyceps australis]|uniref:Uncharacterized protein n=1 Tax=Ophiocordyceps australis TaxID=1399860 RepID=A0A2C5YLH8_9HYPO|nr:hypothetical protein CDD82_798 [Ophiocordyceps australis]